MPRFPSLRAIAAIAVFCISQAAHAATANGNDFALFLSEAKTPVAKQQLLTEARDKPHYFRYLEIIEMKDTAEGGISIVAFEPSSYLDVKFTVTMPNSLAVLREAPASAPGAAIAVTGKFAGLEPGTGAILLENTIVRNKDRLSPKAGQELLGEVKPGSTFYSYTEGPRPIMLEFRDRDLLVNRDRIIAQGGPKAWFDYLEKELAARKKQRAAEAAALVPKR